MARVTTLVLLTFALLLVTGGAGSLRAESLPSPGATGATDDAAHAARAEAKRHFDKAVALYNDDDFNAALVEFETSYQIYPTPGLLYNIGLTQKVLFRYVDAIASLSRYLVEARDPPAERMAEVRQLIADMKALLAEVTLTISPAGTTVSIDGRTIGTAPLPPIPLAAGHHLLELEAPDHRPLRKELIVIAGKPIARSFELQAIPQTGIAHITASPSSSIIRVDGVAALPGTVDFELAPGGHTLEISAPGYQPQRNELAIAAGQVRQVTVRLDPVPRRRRIYERWWFWTLIGGGAGVAAVGAAATVTTRTPTPVFVTLPGSGELP
jgi:hypothetical protein